MVVTVVRSLMMPIDNGADWSNTTFTVDALVSVTHYSSSIRRNIYNSANIVGETALGT